MWALRRSVGRNHSWIGRVIRRSCGDERRADRESVLACEIDGHGPAHIPRSDPGSVGSPSPAKPDLTPSGQLEEEGGELKW